MDEVKRRLSNLSNAAWLALTVAVGAILILCTGCQKTINVEPFKDYIMEVKETHDYVTATGLSGTIYVLDGKFAAAGLTATSGEEITAHGKVWFPIRELLIKYPEAATPRTVAAAVKQEKNVLKLTGPHCINFSPENSHGQH